MVSNQKLNIVDFIRLMMEKYDGVRVYWDGTRLFTKNLQVAIDVPKELKFPAVPFEGELW
jgi:hypothetical protein